MLGKFLKKMSGHQPKKPTAKAIKTLVSQTTRQAPQSRRGGGGRAALGFGIPEESTGYYIPGGKFGHGRVPQDLPPVRRQAGDRPASGVGSLRGIPKVVQHKPTSTPKPFLKKR